MMHTYAVKCLDFIHDVTKLCESILQRIRNCKNTLRNYMQIQALVPYVRVVYTCTYTHVVEQPQACLHACMVTVKSEWMNEWMNEWVSECMDEWEWMIKIIIKLHQIQASTCTVPVRIIINEWTHKTKGIEWSEHCELCVNKLSTRKWVMSTCKCVCVNTLTHTSGCWS